MKTKLVYVTYDGEQFESKKEAEKHLDVLYSNIITPLAHQLVNVIKYKDMSEFIDGNLHKFIELQKVKDDFKLINNEGDFWTDS